YFMRVVNVRELKSRLSRYLRDVRAGDVLLVTDRGTVVAELRPPTVGDHAVSGAVSGLVRMAEEGLAMLGGARNRKAYRRALVAGACADWTLIEPSAAVLDRAGLPFPAEPIRALDAAHLASALVAREATGALELVTTDERVRKNARLLGLAVLP